MNKRRIGYISRILPSISETFVIREMKALEEKGLDVIPFSVHKPKAENFHKEAEDIFKNVTVLKKPGKISFWLSHFIKLFTSPKRYLGTFFSTVFDRGLSFRKRLKIYSQFILAPYAARQFEKAKISHIHAHFCHIPTAVAMMGARMAGITYSFTIHSYGLFVDKLILRQKMERAAFVCTVSNFNKHYLAEHYPGVAEDKTNVIRCCIDPAMFTPSLAQKVTPPLVLGIGRLVELKGFHTLVEACHLLKQSGLPFQCVIVGDGPVREKLQKQIEDLELEESVILVGTKQQEEVKELFGQASVFALPSCIREYQDNLPVVLIESLAMGVPAISTRITAIPEIILDGTTGLLIDPESPGQLAEAISRILNNPELAEQYTIAGRKHIEKEFNATRKIQQLVDLFESVHK